MAPGWTRYLLFPEQPPPASPPMWDRPSAGGPLISLEPNPGRSAMWARAGNRAPIFEEAVPSPSGAMWSRAPTGVPVCPCCVSAAASHAVAPSPTAAGPPLRSVPSTPRSLRSVPSSLGLRIRRSLAQLRKRPSAASL